MPQHDSTAAPETPAADPFAAVRDAESPPLPTKYVSSTSVAVGEAIRFRVDRLSLVEDRDDSDRQVAEISGTVLQSHASRFHDDQELVVTCKAIRLEQMANELATHESETGLVVTLHRAEDQGKRIEWKWQIEPAAIADAIPMPKAVT